MDRFFKNVIFFSWIEHGALRHVLHWVRDLPDAGGAHGQHGVRGGSGGRQPAQPLLVADGSAGGGAHAPLRPPDAATSQAARREAGTEDTQLRQPTHMWVLKKIVQATEA